MARAGVRPLPSLRRAGHTAADCLLGGSAVEFLAMSEALAFDSHQFVEHLMDSGFTEEQAESLATEQVALLNSNLATKAELVIVQRKIEALRQATKAAMEVLKSDMLKWLFGALIAQGGLIVG